MRAPLHRRAILARLRGGRALLMGVLALAGSAALHAGNLSRGTTANAPGAAAASGSQTVTPATTSTAQATEAAIMAQRAQISLQRSVAVLQAVQAQAAAQSAARNLSFGSGSANNLGTATQMLPDVPNGLAGNVTDSRGLIGSGLVPGVAGVDPADPRTIAIPVPVTANAGGGGSVTLGVGTSLTIPGTVGSSQVTVSGSGTVGSITTGGVITPLTGGVATTVPAGSTISLTQGGTVSFAAGSSIPTSVSTYAYPAGASGTANVPASWTGVGGISQATYAAGTGQSAPATTVTIDQTSQQALLTWQSFNVGKNTTLDFDQSLGGSDVANWVAINKVAAGIAPSQILGAIQAPGQVYVINQNGILFGGSSQINLGALVASTLPINDNLLQNGLLNNPDDQFLFSQLNIAAGTQTPAFTPAENSPAPGTSGNGGLVVQVGSNGALSLVPANGRDGDIDVEPGAQIASPTTPEHVGGKIALIGPNVNNGGTLSSPDGQVILAAGLQAEFSASSDPTLRGLNVAVGAETDPGYAGGAGGSGTATNNGDIETPRADTLITGENVNQFGLINSSTSVSLNGRVDLLADYDSQYFINSVNNFPGATGLYATQTGAVTFGPGSVTQIQPELASTDTIVGTTLALPSEMNIEGRTVELQANAMVSAPSANLTVNAGTFQLNNSGYQFYSTNGQVYLDQGATIDVSGSENVQASVTEDIIPVQLLGTELANSPLQQNGPLRGQTVDIDIRQTGVYDGTAYIGTPIGDVSGYANLVEHTVGELTTAGGTVTINAGSSVVTQPGSAIDVSGGWINYQGALIQTTKVVSNGIIYDISQATPDRIYSGVYVPFSTSSAKYGLSQSYPALYTTSTYDPGYVQGGNGGTLSITAPSMALDGSLQGSTVAGSQQTVPISQLAKTYAGATFLPLTEEIDGIPDSSSLLLSFQGISTAYAPNYPASSPTPPTVVFVNGTPSQTPVGPFATDPVTGDPLALPTARLATVDLSSDLVNLDGFGSLSIVDEDGSIVLPANVSLSLPLGGSVSGGTQHEGGAVTFSAANIDLEGTITAPGGALSFSVYDFSPYALLADSSLGGTTPPPDPTRGNFTLGATGSLSTAGLVVDQGAPGLAATIPPVIDGGTVSIAGYNVDLATGSIINSSGGAVITSANKQTFGQGGSITIAAGQDLQFPAIPGGKLVLGSTLEGYAGATGGSLSIKAPLIQIGGTSLENGDTLATGNTLWLDPTDANGNVTGPDFFSQGGFGKFTLSGLGEPILDGSGNPVLDSAGNPEFMPAVLIAAGTQLDPVAASWQVVTGSGGNSYLQAVTLPLASERTPISFSFNAGGVNDSGTNLLVVRGDFVMGLGASLRTDPQSNSQNGVAIKGQTVAILGSIIAPGGTISISGASNFPNASSQPLLAPTVDLGPQSLLSTKGAVVLTENAFGYTTGSVLAGGTIVVKGDIVAEEGSVLDVSGASGVLDVQPAQAGLTTNISDSLVPLLENSNGGSITLSGGQELFTDATLLGAAGGSTAQGGSLSISSGIYLPLGAVENPADTTLLVTQGDATIPVPSYYPAGKTAIGYQVKDAQGNPLNGLGYFAVDSFDNPVSGFAALTLGGTVQFQGPIDITAARSIAVGVNNSAGGGVISANATVNLTAPYVELGQAFISPLLAQQQRLGDAFVYVNSAGGAVDVAPVYGTGSLNVSATLVDVGNLSLQNIGQTSLTATDGDVRGDGILDVAGSLTITAGQIYPMTDTTFTLAAFDHGGVAGSITILGSGSRALPLSAGGTLNLYATDISQGGVLRAPIGTINLGSGVTSGAPTDLTSGVSYDTTATLILQPGSQTSVSEVDPVTGVALDIPYGVNVNGVQWLDPAGNDITTAGNGTGAIPAKGVFVSAQNVQDLGGSIIDISGGGDIYSYQFVSGTGGTIDQLNLANKSYAILPSSYSATPTAVTFSPGFSGDGYSTNDSPVAVGQEIYLSGGNGLQAGFYTLLPSIYALQPGAYLVTPSSTGQSVGGAQPLPVGASIVSGYMVNGLGAPSAAPLFSSFQVDPPTLVAQLADYNITSGTTFFAQNATTAGTALPRLPVDAGQLVLAAEATLTVDGSVLSQTGSGGLGSLVDIASPNNILIAGSDADLSSVAPSTLILNAASLSAFGADSLLIGGYRGEDTSVGTPVTVTTSNLTVDNSGAGNALTGPDVILVSKDDLTLDTGAQVDQGTRSLTGAAPTLVLGSTSVAASGDGALLRVTSDANARIVRQSINPSLPAFLSVGQGAILSATNLILDSTDQATLLSTSLSGNVVSIDSGLISLVLNTGASSPTPGGLVLNSATLANLQSGASNLSLLSYSSIDIYGSGSIGGASVAGVYPISGFELHAAAIRGDGGDVSINAGTISLDNSAGATAPGTTLAATSGGTLAFNANTIQLGAAGQTTQNGLNVQGYDGVLLDASNEILLEGAGSTTSSTGSVTRGQFNLSVTGSAPHAATLTLQTPLITGLTAANQTISVGGVLDVTTSAPSATAAVPGGLGATLALTGDSVTVDSSIILPSGSIQIEATSGDLSVGTQAAAQLDVGGITESFQDVDAYTSGGLIGLTADAGSVDLGSGSTLNLASPAAGGNGGSLTVKASEGTFLLGGGVLQGSGGTGGTNGNFALDVGTIDTSTSLAGNDLTPLETVLDAGNFTNAQTIRVRGGVVGGTTFDDVYLTGQTATDDVRALTYQLSADSGSIIVQGGAIDASGATGGSITLSASGSVVLTSGATLDASGQNFSNAGQGGTVTLDAGSETGGAAPVSSQPRNGTTGDFTAGTPVVDIESGSMINLSVVATTPSAGATVSLTAGGSSYLTLPQATAFTLPGGTPGNDTLTLTSAGTVTANGVTTPFSAGASLSNLPAGSSIALSAPATVLFDSGSTGGAVPVALASGVNYTLGALGDATGILHLRAPQLADGSDVQIDPLQGSLLDPSSVVIEGYKVYTPAGGTINSALENTVYTDASAFAANTNTILTSLLGSSPSTAQEALYQVTPGVEIVNPTGNLTLTNTWDLSTFRFGPNANPSIVGSGVAGDLTLRAAGNIVLGYGNNSSASLTDGFTGYDGSTTDSLWQATVMPGQSWSYQLTAGADFTAAALNDVLPTSLLAGLGGSVQLGKGAPALPTATNGSTGVIIPQFYQVIRTGVGNITISAAGDVQLLNPIATIYTAGAEAAPLADFALPDLSYSSTILGSNLSPSYDAAYTQSGGNVEIYAQGNIGSYQMSGSNLIARSTKEVPTNWLFRQGFLQNGQFAATNPGGPIAATSWWVDFGNFFEGVGALGGGNVSLVAGHDVSNVDAAVPTNARMPGAAPSASSLIELGGGDLLVQAGNDISGGVYYVERGEGTLDAGGSIHTNSTRATLNQTSSVSLGSNPADSTTWLPTTLYLGQGSFDVAADGSALLGPVVNPFLLPQSLYNSFLNKTYFSTYAETDSINVSALTGTVTVKNNDVYLPNGTYSEGAGSLASWYSNVLRNTTGSFAKSQPWLALVETSTSPFDPAEALFPSTLNATAFSSDIDLVGSLVLAPAPDGTLNLLASNGVNGFQPSTVTNPSSTASLSNPIEWASTLINLSDADPASIPSPVDPESFSSPATGRQNVSWANTGLSIFESFNNLFSETGATDGVLQTEEALHTKGLLHADDPEPLRIYALGGDISGITLFSGKSSDLVAERDITDVSLYVQNDQDSGLTLVSAGRDIIAYDPTSALRLDAQTPGNALFGASSGVGLGVLQGAPTNGDLQISGPGTLEVLAGRNLDLGVSSIAQNGTGVGIASVGNQRDPYLPFAGADVVAAGGITDTPHYSDFISQFLTPGTDYALTYLPDLATLLDLGGASNDQVWAAFNQLPASQQDLLVQDIFYLVLRDAGRSHTAGTGSGYAAGYAAIAALFPGDAWQGDISLTSREIITENGGNISLFAPGGQLTVGFDLSSGQPIDQGILTEDGGNISIFTKNSVNVGTSRIFTLNGGNVIIWSTVGNIAAGASSKTVQSAPPTRVVVDPQSAAVKTDLSGLATGGGIGVLQTVMGAAASDVDLIAPSGTVDAGDAGIRASGNLNIAAVQVLNAGNIQVGGKSSGVPTTAAPNLAGLASASAAAGAANNAASQVGQEQRNQQNTPSNDLPSIITVEVLGYGGA